MATNSFNARNGISVGSTPIELVDASGNITTTGKFNNLTITSNTAGTQSLSIAQNKTLTVSNTLTLTGTDSSSVAFGAGGTVGYVGSPLSQFAVTTSAQLRGIMSDSTGASGGLVFANTPTLITPAIGAATGTSLTVTGSVTSTVVTGTAPFIATSTTVCTNLNAAMLNGTTWTAPGAIGGGTAAAGNFTTLGASGATSLAAVTITGAILTGANNTINSSSGTLIIGASTQGTYIDTASTYSVYIRNNGSNILTISGSGVTATQKIVTPAVSASISGSINIPSGSGNTSGSGDLYNLSGALTFNNGSVKTIAYTDSNITGSAASATNLVITNDTTNASSVYPTWVTATSGTIPVYASSTKLSFVPNTGILTINGATALTSANYTSYIVGATSTTLTDATTTNWNLNNGNIATLTLTSIVGSSRTFAAPTNMGLGSMVLIVKQPATGGPLYITWNAIFKWSAGTPPVLSTTANATDVFSFFYDGTYFYGSYIRGAA